MKIFSFNSCNNGFYIDWNKRYNQTENCKINSLWYFLENYNPEYDVLNLARSHSQESISWKDLIQYGYIGIYIQNVSGAFECITEQALNETEVSSSWKYVIYPYRLKWRQGIYIDRDSVFLENIKEPINNQENIEYSPIAANHIFFSNVHNSLSLPSSLEQWEEIFINYDLYQKYKDCFLTTNYWTTIDSIPNFYYTGNSYFIWRGYRDTVQNFQLYWYLATNLRYSFQREITEKSISINSEEIFTIENFHYNNTQNYISSWYINNNNNYEEVIPDYIINESEKIINNILQNKIVYTINNFINNNSLWLTIA